MASITVRFDAKYLKDEILRVVDTKVKGVTTNSEVYNDLLWSFQEAMARVLPKDTGALAYGVSGVSEKNGKTRIGDIHTTSKGLVYNPIEIQHDNSDVHYGGYVIKPEHIASASIDPMFLKDAQDIILREMKK